MKGTTSLLRLLFGTPLGTDYYGEHITVNGGHSIHLFDAFALVNYLMCSALPASGGTRGMSTPTMHRNCRQHFRKVLNILEPSVVVVQGRGFWASIQQSFDHVQRTGAMDAPYVLARLNGRDIPIAVFTHPSARGDYNWGWNAQTPYLLNTVVPTVELIRQRLFGRD